MKIKSNLLIVGLIFLFIVLGAKNDLLAWDDYAISDPSKDCFSENNTSYGSDYSTDYYTVNEYRGISGANNELGISGSSSPIFSSFVIGGGGEDDFASDGGSVDNDVDYNDNFIVTRSLPLGDGITGLFLLAMLYSLYIRFRIQIKNNNVNKQL